MGRMTVVSILNDAWEIIKSYPKEFIENIEKGMNHTAYLDGAVKWYSVGNCCNPMEVAASFHADVPQVFYVGENSMTMLTDNSQKRKSEIEFQLERIRKAKRLLNRQEKILMEKSVKFDKYKPGDLLFCNQELSRLDKNGSNAVLEKGQYYHLVTIIDDYAYFKSDSTEPIIIPVLDIDYYFEKGEK